MQFVSSEAQRRNSYLLLSAEPSRPSFVFFYVLFCPFFSYLMTWNLKYSPSCHAPLCSPGFSLFLRTKLLPAQLYFRLFSVCEKYVGGYSHGSAPPPHQTETYTSSLWRWAADRLEERRRMDCSGWWNIQEQPNVRRIVSAAKNSPWSRQSCKRATRAARGCIKGPVLLWW